MRAAIPHANRFERAARIATAYRPVDDDGADRWPWLVAAPVIGVLAVSLWGLIAAVAWWWAA